MDRVEEQSEEIQWFLIADWLVCPSCQSRDVNVRRDRRDGEVTLHCPKCHDSAIAITGEAISTDAPSGDE